MLFTDALVGLGVPAGEEGRKLVEAMLATPVAGAFGVLRWMPDALEAMPILDLQDLYLMVKHIALAE